MKNRQISNDDSTALNLKNFENPNKYFDKYLQISLKYDIHPSLKSSCKKDTHF